MPEIKHRNKAVAASVDEGPKKWLSVPDAGRIYYGLSRNGSYDAATRGEIPTVRVGRLLKVPIHLMEQLFNKPRKANAA